jgi:hypothetical protein
MAVNRQVTKASSHIRIMPASNCCNDPSGRRTGSVALNGRNMAFRALLKHKSDFGTLSTPSPH